MPDAAPAAPAVPPPGRLAWAGLAVLLLAGLALRAAAMAYTPRTQDEVVYTYLANDIHHHGLEGYRRMFSLHNAQPILQRGPSPLRAGYLALLSAFMSGEGAQDIRIGMRISVGAGVLTLALAAWLGFRHLGTAPTFLGLMALAVSPLELFLAGRTWLDGPLEASTLLALAALFGAASRPSPLRLTLLALAAFWLVLLKESAPLILALMGLACLPVLPSGTRRRAFAAMLGGTLAAACLIVLLAGSAGTAWTTLANTLRIFPTDVRDPGRLERVDAYFQGIPLIDDPEAHLRGPWHGVPAALAALSPWSALLGLAGILLALRRGAPPFVRALGLFTAAYLLLSSVQPKTLRWAAPGNAGLHLMAGWAAWRLAKALEGRLGDFAGPAVLALALAAARADHAHWRRLVDRGVADPTVVSVLRESRDAVLR